MAPAAPSAAPNLPPRLALLGGFALYMGVLGLVAWSLLSFIPPLSEWSDGDRPLIVGDLVFFCATWSAVQLVVLFFNRERHSPPATQAWVTLGASSGVLWITITAALLLSARFDRWTIGWPGWIQGVALLYYVVSGGAFVATLAVIWFYPTLTEGIGIEQARDRVQRLVGGITAFVYGSGLYFSIGAIALGGADEPRAFLRAHLFDGFTCAAAITVGLELASRLRAGSTKRASWVSFIAIYFAIVSAAIGASAAFVAGVDEGSRILAWAGLCAALGGIVGAIIGLGLAQKMVDNLSTAVREWAKLATASSRPGESATVRPSSRRA